MNQRSIPFTFLLFGFVSILISCNNRPVEYYSQKEREKIRAYKPNILFTNYHVLDAEKFIELKSSIGDDSIAVFKIVCSFLDGFTLKFDGKVYEINHYFQTIDLPNSFDLGKNDDLSFELNGQQFSFPRSKIMTSPILNMEKNIGVETKLNWESGDPNDAIILCLRPNPKDCGKENSKGQKIGTIPKLIVDDGEYIFTSDDFLSVGLEYKNEVTILLKRGKYKIEKMNTQDKTEEICISNISHSTYRTRIK